MSRLVRPSHPRLPNPSARATAAAAVLAGALLRAPAYSDPAAGDSAAPAASAPPSAPASPAVAPAAPAAPASPAAAPGKVSTPWPRRYVLPDPGLEPFDGAERPPAWDPTRWRFTVVATLASWNPASEGAIAWLGSLAAELSARRVLVLGAFSHDTAPSASRFAKVTRPRFPSGLASGAFLKAMGNPKVPTVWVIDPRGEIVARKELPDAAEREELRGRLRLWTDF